MIAFSAPLAARTADFSICSTKFSVCRIRLWDNLRLFRDWSNDGGHLYKLCQC